MKYFNGEHSFYEEKFSSIKSAGSLSPKILTCGVAHPEVRMFELHDRISRRNRNRIRQHFSLFISGPDELESWKNEGIQSGDMVPYR